MMYYRCQYEKNVEITDVEIKKIEKGKQLKLALDKFFMISGDYYPTFSAQRDGNSIVSMFTIDYEADNEAKILAMDTYLNIKGLLRKVFPVESVTYTCELLETKEFDIQIAVTRREETDNLERSLKDSLNFFIMLSGVFKGDVRYERYEDERLPMINEEGYDNVVRIKE